MRERAALAAFLAFTAAGAVTVVIVIMLLSRFLEERDAAWLRDIYDGPQEGQLSPAQLSELHEEVRRITREAP